MYFIFQKNVLPMANAQIISYRAVSLLKKYEPKYLNYLITTEYTIPFDYICHSISREIL